MCCCSFLNIFSEKNIYIFFTSHTKFISLVSCCACDHSLIDAYLHVLAVQCLITCSSLLKLNETNLRFEYRIVFWIHLKWWLLVMNMHVSPVRFYKFYLNAVPRIPQLFLWKTRWCTVAFVFFLSLLLILRQRCSCQTFILWFWEKVRAHSTFSVAKQYCERRTLYGLMQVALGWDAHPSLYMMCACEKGAHIARTETPLFVFHSVRTEVAVWHSQEIALHISELLKGENR